MKQLRKPTRNEKELIQKAELDWKEWGVSAVSNTWIIIINKSTGEKKVIWT